MENNRRSRIRSIGNAVAAAAVGIVERSAAVVAVDQVASSRSRGRRSMYGCSSDASMLTEL